MNTVPFLSARHYAWITLAFVAFVIYGSLVPLAPQPVPIETAWGRFSRAFTQPVEVAHRSDWLANILLFIPLGFIGMGCLCVDQIARASLRRTSASRRTSVNPLAVGILLVGFVVLSALIEFAQIWFPPRDTSINDVAAETFGGTIGIGLWLVAGQATTDYLRRFWSTHGERHWAIRLMPGYLFILVIAQGIPFDLTLSPSVLGRKLREGRVLPVPFTLSSDEPLDLVRKGLVNFAYFLPAGLLIAGLPGWTATGRNAGWRVLGLGILLAGAIEGLQLFVFTRYFDATDILTGSVAVLAGWWLMRFFLSEPDVRPGRRLPAALFLAWVAALVFIQWEPFDFAIDDALAQQRWQALSIVPFADYYAGNYLMSFSTMLDKMLLFVPFGLLLASATGTRGPWIVIVSGFLFAFLLESGQILLHRHTPGVSDLILETLGAWLGSSLAKRLRSWTLIEPAFATYSSGIPNR